MTEEIRPHFSMTQLNSYLDCPYRYYLGYIEKLPWEKLPSAVAFGSSIHRAIERFNRTLLDGGMDEETIITVFEEQFKVEAARDKIEFKDKDEKDELLEKGKGLILLYHQQFSCIKPQSIERTFRLPILDPATGLFVPTRDILGVIDLVAEDEIIEIKTTGKSMTQKESDSSLQLTLYSWAYRLIRGREEKAIKTVNLVKNSKPVIQTMETHRTALDHTRLMELMAQVIRAIDAGVFYRNPNSKYGCDGCVYYNACNGK
jgi:RecB family exonuclease